MGGGFSPGQILNIVGGPGSLKTSLAMQSVLSFIHQGRHALVFSLDMPASEILSRVLLADFGSSLNAIEDAIRQGDPAYEDAKRRVLPLLDQGLRILDGPDWNPERMTRAIDHFHPHLVMIDYVSIATNDSDAYRASNAVMRWARDEAKRSNAVFLLLHQMGKESLINQSKGIIGNNALGGGAAQQTAWAEVELLKENTPEGPNVVATITKARRGGGTGRSYQLEVDWSRYRFTGRAAEVRRGKSRASKVFETIQF